MFHTPNSEGSFSPLRHQPLQIKKNTGRIFFQKLHLCQISSKSAIPSWVRSLVRSEGLSYACVQVACQWLKEIQVVCQWLKEIQVACQWLKEIQVACQWLKESQVACQWLKESQVACQWLENIQVACQWLKESQVVCQWFNQWYRISYSIRHSKSWVRSLVRSEGLSHARLETARNLFAEKAGKKLHRQRPRARHESHHKTCRANLSVREAISHPNGNAKPVAYISPSNAYLRERRVTLCVALASHRSAPEHSRVPTPLRPSPVGLKRGNIVGSLACT